jgi:hypothetical protein
MSIEFIQGIDVLSLLLVQIEFKVRDSLACCLSSCQLGLVHRLLDWCLLKQACIEERLILRVLKHDALATQDGFAL